MGQREFLKRVVRVYRGKPFYQCNVFLKKLKPPTCSKRYLPLCQGHCPVGSVLRANSLTAPCVSPTIVRLYSALNLTMECNRHDDE